MRDIKKFPMIRLSGKDMTNVIPQAGIFSAKIQKKNSNEIVNLVVMLASEEACKHLEQIYNSTNQNLNFCVEGHILPPKEGNCYSVLYVTYAVVLGNKLRF